MAGASVATEPGALAALVDVLPAGGAVEAGRAAADVRGLEGQALAAVGTRVGGTRVGLLAHLPWGARWGGRGHAGVQGQLPGTVEVPAWRKPVSTVSLIAGTPRRDTAIFLEMGTEVPGTHGQRGQGAPRPDPDCPLQSSCSLESSPSELLMQGQRTLGTSLDGGPPPRRGREPRGSRSGCRGWKGARGLEGGGHGLQKALAFSQHVTVHGQWGEGRGQGGGPHLTSRGGSGTCTRSA